MYGFLGRGDTRPHRDVSERRRVWLISKYISKPPSEGAPGARGFELMREIAGLGHDVTIFAATSNHLTAAPVFEGGHLVEMVDGVQICWIKTVGFERANSLRRILSWIHFEIALLLLRKRRFGRPDVVIASSLSLLSVLTGMAFRLRYRARLVFEVRDIWPLSIVEDGGFSDRNLLVRGLAAVERLGYSRADAIVGTMPGLGEHVSGVLGRSRVTYCVPQGVAPRTLADPEPLPMGYAESYLDHDDQFTIGYAGTVGLSNALQPFFEAAQMLEQDSRFRFIVVGGGGMLAHYEEQWSHLSNLTFAPKVARGQVPSVLKEFDLLYVSMLDRRVYDYGMSLNKLMDYMLAAKPVVANYSGFPSMVNEADCGSFIPAGNSVALVEEVRRYAALPEEERAAIGVRGREWLLANRTYEKLARNYADILFSPSSNQTTERPA